MRAKERDGLHRPRVGSRGGRVPPLTAELRLPCRVVALASVLAVLRVTGCVFAVTTVAQVSSRAWRLPGEFGRRPRGQARYARWPRANSPSAGLGGCERSEGGAYGLARRCGGAPSPASWVSAWVERETSHHPVVLFADVTAEESQAARQVLQQVRVHHELVDVSALADAALPNSAGASLPALITEHLASASGKRGLPQLVVGGRFVGGAFDIAELAASGELQDLCRQAGAERLAPERPAAQLPWTERENLRMQPPKDMNGRRWYQDAPNSARYPDEHADTARIEYNIDSVSPGAGTEQRGRFTGAGKALLRHETNLDEPDASGMKKPIAPFCDVNLVLEPDLGWAYYIRSRDIERAENVTAEDVAREGLTKAQLRWVYSQGKKKLVDELMIRQCRSKILNTLDVQDLRTALMDEMRKERAFSPTQQGVVPGIVQSLSGRGLRAERHADTDVPLLVAIMSERSPACFHLRDRLQTAAKRALRGLRIVRVDGHRYPEVAREFGVTRYPTLVWLAPRTGEELHREVGVVSAAAIVDRASALWGRRELPAPRDAPGLPVARETLDQTRWSTNGGVLVEEQRASRWHSRRALRNSVGTV